MSEDNKYELGEWLPYPIRKEQDRDTCFLIWKLTNGEGNNRHIYFNRPNFTGDSRYVIFMSDRTGKWDIFLYDLLEECVKRLTDCKHNVHRVSVDQYRPLIYYTQKSAVHRLDINTLDDQVMYNHNTLEGGSFILMDLSEDGQYLGFLETGPYERLDDSVSDFVQRFEVRPLSRLWVMTSDGAKIWKVHEEKRHLQHFLFNPTDPSTILYCHEGPWDRVEQRMWSIKWDGSCMRPLRYQEVPEIAIGHEFWFPDGRNVAYMYHRKGIASSVRMYDVLKEEERTIVEHPFCHFICNSDGNMIVGDDSRYVTLYDISSGVFTYLAEHAQELTIANTLYHPHPAFSPDGRKIVFCRKDKQGQNDVCIIDINEN